MDTSDNLAMTQKALCRIEDPRPAFVFEKETAKERAQRWGRELKAHWDATEASPLEGADSAISAWAADQCNKALGPEPLAGEEKLHGNLVRSARERELAALGKFKVF